MNADKRNRKFINFILSFFMIGILCFEVRVRVFENKLGSLLETSNVVNEKLALLDKVSVDLVQLNQKLSSIEDAIDYTKAVGKGLPATVVIHKNLYVLGTKYSRVELPCGSGMVLDSKEGLILTAKHLLGRSKDPNDFLVIIGKKKMAVTDFAIDSYLDIAVLKVSTSDPNYCLDTQVKLGNSNELKSGDKVFVLGNPKSFIDTVTMGIISNPSVNLDGVLYLQTDAAINPGNSGGPLININGEVVGLVNSFISPDPKYLQNSGIGFAVPSSSILERLREFEVDMLKGN